MFTPDPYGGKDLESFIIWTIQQFQKLANLHAEFETDSVLFTEIHAAPDKPSLGVIYLADGSDWDPLAVGGADPYFVWHDGAGYHGLHEDGNGANLA